MIFERFVKLNTFVQGTGLGLAICRVIVEKLGGEITAESKLNEGSTFRFTIPYKAGKKCPESGRGTKCPESGSTGLRKVLQRRTVLVAEDVDSNFLLLKTLLGKRCNLLWAKDGEDAVNQFKEHQPDLIFDGYQDASYGWAGGYAPDSFLFKRSAYCRFDCLCF